MSQSSQSHQGYRVIGIIFLGSVLIGAWAYRQYVVSKNALHQDQAHFQEVGLRASPEQCVDEVVHWITQCQAMKSLCDVTVPRMMKTCLSAQPRTQACQSYGTQTADTHFGYNECQARQVTKKNKKACALAYRVIDRYCGQLTLARGTK